MSQAQREKEEKAKAQFTFLLRFYRSLIGWLVWWRLGDVQKMSFDEKTLTVQKESKKMDFSMFQFIKGKFSNDSNFDRRTFTC